MRGHTDMFKVLTGDGLRAYQHQIKSGVIDVSMANDLTGVAAGNDRLLRGAVGTAMNAPSFTFHHVERFYREANALASYRLGPSRHRHDVAYAVGGERTYAKHCDYATRKQVRIMQGYVARVLVKTFERAHRTALRTDDNLKCSGQFSRHNFVPHEYIDERGNTQRSVTMTRDGLTMLAMGFTGPSAMAFKEAYIAAFNAMSNHTANHEQNSRQMYQALSADESESFVALLIASERMAPRQQRRHTTGRNQQINIKATAEIVEQFHRLADELGVPLDEVLARALKALEATR